MEDNPGFVTDEMEEKYKSLQMEVSLFIVSGNSLNSNLLFTLLDEAVENRDLSIDGGSLRRESH